jgi:hypothetical protein
LPCLATRLNRLPRALHFHSSFFDHFPARLLACLQGVVGPARPSQPGACDVPVFLRPCHPDELAFPSFSPQPTDTAGRHLTRPGLRLGANYRHRHCSEPEPKPEPEPEPALVGHVRAAIVVPVRSSVVHKSHSDGGLTLRKQHLLGISQHHVRQGPQSSADRFLTRIPPIILVIHAARSWCFIFVEISF